MKHYYTVKWDERGNDGHIHNYERHFDDEQEQTRFWFTLHHNSHVVWICKTTEIITDRY